MLFEKCNIHDRVLYKKDIYFFVRGTGFGFRRRVLTLGSGNDDNTLTLLGEVVVQ